MKVRAVMVSKPTTKTAKTGRDRLGRPRLTGGPRRVADPPILGHALPTGRVGAQGVRLARRRVGTRRAVVGNKWKAVMP
jgi:hypothetical protein